MEIQAKSKNPKISKMFGKSLGISSDRCYSNYKEMAEKERKKKNGINVVSIMTPPASHQIIAEQFINKNIHIISDKPLNKNLASCNKLTKIILIAADDLNSIVTMSFII